MQTLITKQVKVLNKLKLAVTRIRIGIKLNTAGENRRNMTNTNISKDVGEKGRMQLNYAI